MNVGTYSIHSCRIASNLCWKDIDRNLSDSQRHIVKIIENLPKEIDNRTFVPMEDSIAFCLALSAAEKNSGATRTRYHCIQIFRARYTSVAMHAFGYINTKRLLHLSKAFRFSFSKLRIYVPCSVHSFTCQFHIIEAIVVLLPFEQSRGPSCI